MRYLLKYGAALTLLVATLSSCREEPTYPETPQIEFRGVENIKYTPVVDDQKKPTGIITASLTIVIGYQDGNGDLGLNPLDITSPNPTDPDSQPPFNDGSPYENNFIADLFIKKPVEGSPGDSAFVRYLLPVEGFDFSGRFQRLTTDERVETLEGEIRYTLDNSITNEFFNPGDIIKFQIYIYDRNTPVPNKSNIVETTPIKLTFK